MSEENDTWLKTIPLLNSKVGQKIARKTCQKHGFSHDIAMELVESEVKAVRMIRRSTLFQSFDDIFTSRNSDVD